MQPLYPEITPFKQFYLQTGGIHLVYVEQSGNPAGIPVIFLHGGPCSGTKPDHRRFFNPKLYHIILMDQRGCGLSQPYGELQDNTTQDLLEDLEQLRKHLRIEQWLLFGGSWGATLALLYAQRHPQQVSAMVLRGTFLARQADMTWFLGNGVNHIYPRQWRDLLDSLPSQHPDNIADSLYEAVFGADLQAAANAARQWQNWSGLVALGPDYQPNLDSLTESILQQVKMELHYAKNAYFIAENQILQNCSVLQNIPTIIIHGQQDLTCPLESGWLLHQALPQSRLIVLAHAGHIARGADMLDALVSACDEMARIC